MRLPRRGCRNSRATVRACETFARVKRCKVEAQPKIDAGEAARATVDAAEAAKTAAEEAAKLAEAKLAPPRRPTKVASLGSNDAVTTPCSSMGNPLTDRHAG